ncbi:MAG: toxin-antitoxin system protein [Vicinamibacterales bacterium]
MQTLVERAIETYRRKRILEAANRTYAALKANPEAWKEELAERALWDNSLADGAE